MIIDDIHFEKKDWEYLMYDLSKVAPGKDILSFYAPLAQMPEFAVPVIIDGKTMDKNEVIRYIMVLYDRNSKYNVCKDSLKMRECAAIVAGWKPDKKTGRFPKEAEKIMRGMIPSVNKMAIRYCRIYHNFEYTGLVSDLIAWYKLCYDMNGEVNGKDDASIQMALKNMNARKEALEKNIAAKQKTILSVDQNPFMKEELFIMLEDDADDIVLSPERMAIVKDSKKEEK